MEVQHSDRSLPGHPDCGMITIVYDFVPGVQVLWFNKIKDINNFVYHTCIIENEYYQVYLGIEQFIQVLSGRLILLCCFK